MSTSGSHQIPDKAEMGNLEFVRWRKIWICINTLGIAASLIAFASVPLFGASMATCVPITLLGITFLVIGVFIDGLKLGKIRKRYGINTEYASSDQSKAAKAARKAEEERIWRLMEADREEAARREAAKAERRAKKG